MRWIAVWTRAVVVPAWRRSLGAALGCAIVAAVIFGPTAMRPSDLTGLALRDPGVGAVLAVTWLLVFAPTARLIVRPQAAAYLATLPGNPGAAWLIGGVALIVLQLPWLVLWLIGEGMRGFGVVVATTVVTIAVARWRPPSAGARSPAWRSALTALAGIHLRALRRRAGDALVRGAGLAILAGVAAGCLIRNNELTGEPAGVLGASILAVVLMPARLGATLVTLAAHRETGWLAHSMGIPRATRIAALVAAVAGVHLAASALGVIAALVIAGPQPWLAAVAVAVALGTALAEARVVLAAEASPAAAARLVVGAIVVAAVAILCLAALDAAGGLALVAVGAVALGTVKP